MPHLAVAFRACATLLLVASIACAPPSTVGGVRATPASPAAVWNAPAGAGAPLTSTERNRAQRGALVPPEIAQRLTRLTLADVVDLALGNSPATRVSWSQARAAAAAFGSARGRYLPTIDASLAAGPARSISSNPARVPADRTTATPAVNLTLLLFDLGGRGGATAAAHEALFAADLAHNAALQSTVLAAEVAYFNHQASRGLFGAAQATVQTARTNLAAAERRHDVGLATIADVLQARTALAQTQLAAQTAEGNVQASRSALALAIGLPANAPFDVAVDSSVTPVRTLAEDVDSLVERTVRNRPDVASARALARQSAAQLRQVRGAALPSITLGASQGYATGNNPVLEGQTYALTFGLSLPLFNGWSRQYDIAAAQENAAAALARAEQSRLSAIAQVFTSYYALRTATQRVATSAELLASATQSEEVARGRYAEGVGSILDLLLAQNALADARAQTVQSRWTWFGALAQLARDAGVLGSRGESNLSFLPDPTGARR